MIRRDSKAVLSCSILVTTVLFLFSTVVQATTIDPATWEELVTEADFVGVIECEVAGGIVAKYTVVDSWKGPAAGSKVALAIAIDGWSRKFPIALYGERYLVAGYKTAPATMVSTSGQGTMPLWWRRIPSDFETPLLQGRTRLTDKEELQREFWTKHSSVDELKQDALELLALAPDEQEERLLRAQIRKYFHWLRAEESVKAGEAKERIGQAKGISDLLQRMLAEASNGDEATKTLLSVAMSRGGRRNTLSLLEKFPPEKWPFSAEDHSRMLARIRNGLGLVPEPVEEPLQEPAAPTPEALEKLRAFVKEHPPRDQVSKALEVLTIYDPAVVVEYLVNWVNPNQEWWDRDSGYALGSYFAWRCRKDRKENFLKLLTAKDPFIRAAGAVYLCFEDRALGMEKLRDISRLEGLPGVWAALNRARRGDKSAMPRLLEIFATPTSHDAGNAQHDILQGRAAILLSNVARLSGLAQPQPPAGDPFEEEHAKKVYAFYTTWWEANADKVELSDPWLPLLESQKVD